MGSKRRIWKDIAPFILSNRNKGQCYVEPFCGGCNSLCNVEGWRLASDINPYLIAMWKSLLNNENQYFPITKDIYQDAYKSYKSNDGRYSLSDLGWIGFIASYNGKFFDGYSGVSNGRDYIRESANNILKQLKLLEGVEFRCCSYDKLIIPKKSIIYCDIPYRETRQYNYNLGFDYEKFYNWCFDKRNEGHEIFISEYWMPNDFRCIYEKKIINNLDRYSELRGIRTEKLFTI